MDQVRRCLKNDQFAAHCGIELISVEPGRARAKMEVGNFHLNGVGLVQGGAIFTLADFTFAAASNSRGTVAVGINVNVLFLKAATSGMLYAEAREIATSRKLGSYTVEVRDDRQELIAMFQGMVYRKRDTLPG